VLMNLGKTNATWRAIGTLTHTFDADADADFSTASPATVRGIVTNNSLTTDQQIIINPNDYEPGTILNVIYLHDSGNGSNLYTIQTNGLGSTDDGIHDAHADAPFSGWDTPDASVSIDFQVMDDGELPYLMFLGAQPLEQAHSVAF